MKRRVTVRLQRDLAAMFDALGSEKVERLAEIMLLQLTEGEASAAMLRAWSGGTKDGAMKRMRLELTLARRLSATARDFGTSPAAIIRAAIGLAPKLTPRLELEKEYKELGGPGVPEVLSSSAMIIWKASQGKGDMTEALAERVVKLEQAIEEMRRRLLRTERGQA